jgi:hypothetical protein
MSDPEIRLPIDTTYSTRAQRPKAWKSWSFRLGFFEESSAKTIRVVVGDVPGILYYQQNPHYLTRTTVESLSQLAKDLEYHWSRYNHGSQDPADQLRNLAAIGRNLFKKLLPVYPADKSELPKLLADAIREAMSRWIEARDPETLQLLIPEDATEEAKAELKAKDKPALSLDFFSNCLHLPWNLLYPFEDFDLYRERGFLGVSCSIEETSDFDYQASTSKKTWGVANPVEVSLQIDDRIATGVHKAVTDQFAVYGPNRITVMPRTESAEFRDALLAKAAKEEIMYFCCHTRERPPQLQLSDPEIISSTDIEDWTSRGDLRQWPVVFLNTCWGAVAYERYRTSFVQSFMRGGAVAVIGVEAEIEQQFAALFAGAFFHEMLAVGSAPESLGDVAYGTRLALWGMPDGVSGLLYSVYSRTPVRFRRIERLRKDAGVVDPSVDVSQGGVRA